MRNKVQATINMDKDLLEQVDSITGPFKRSRYIEEAIRVYLETQKAELKKQLQGC